MNNLNRIKKVIKITGRGKNIVTIRDEKVVISIIYS